MPLKGVLNAYGITVSMNGKLAEMLQYVCKCVHMVSRLRKELVASRKTHDRIEKPERMMNALVSLSLSLSSSSGEKHKNKKAIRKKNNKHMIE